MGILLPFRKFTALYHPTYKNNRNVLMVILWFRVDKLIFLLDMFYTTIEELSSVKGRSNERPSQSLPLAGRLRYSHSHLRYLPSLLMAEKEKGAAYGLGHSVLASLLYLCPVDRFASFRMGAPEPLASDCHCSCRDLPTRDQRRGGQYQLSLLFFGYWAFMLGTQVES
jgi:hypothetical protein